MFFDMKIVSKAYLLIGLLIIAAGFNLFLLYQDDTSQLSTSYSIIRAGDVKVMVELISSLATSVASGNLDDKIKLQNEIDDVEFTLEKIKNGGNLNGQELGKIPSSLLSDYNKVSGSWEKYKTSAMNVKETSVFDPEATSAMNYVLQKNQELVLLTNEMMLDFEGLDRNYNTHKQIAKDLAENSKIIGQQSLLISIGEGENAQQILKEKRIEFEIGMRKLLQISTEGLDVESLAIEYRDLDVVPRENSESLKMLDPLWESVQIKVKILEERALLSSGFNLAKNEMNKQKLILFENIDDLLNSWNTDITSKGSESQIIIQVILAVDIAIFFLVLYVIRQSLSPLVLITNAFSKVKEGVYGEKIEFVGTDEIGQLVNNFNIMSNAIKEKEEEAKKTDIAKNEFLAMITHELKTPLVPIQGYADILLNEHLGKLTNKQKDRISIIKSSSESLLSIISDLLDAQKLELGQLTIKKSNENIKNTISKAIKTLKPEADKKNVKISSDEVDLSINHDSERITQVITNLIKNSLTAVEPDSGKIEVSVDNMPTEIKINVKDNGSGIPQEKQKNLFKKFYQVDATLTRERGGSGLGLAICRGIIEHHGGQISVHSVENQGSTFSFTISKESDEQAKSPVSST